MHACLMQCQFERLLNMIQYLSQNYYRVKERFLNSIDYVEDMTREGQAEDESLRIRRSPGAHQKEFHIPRRGDQLQKREYMLDERD